MSDHNFLKAMNFNESVTDCNFVHLPTKLPDSGPSSYIPQSSFKDEGDLHEDSDFSDLVLKYINQMLMEEDIEEKHCMFQESAALQAAEKSFYNVLMVKDQNHDPDPAAESMVSFGISRSMNGTGLTCDVNDSSILPNTLTNFDSQSRFHPLFSSTSNVVDGFVDSPGRNSKQSAVYSEPTVRSQMFDDVLLCGGSNGSAQGSNGVKAFGKKHKEVVDLRTLLSLCAQSVASNDQRGVTDLLKWIREHASLTGDGMQRLAHYFSAGLEARMAGSGTGIYKALLSRPTSAVDILKAYYLFLGCFPFTKISHFVSNKTIMSVAQNKTKLHIIDFGILYGFQWPCLIQRLSARPGGPPEIRITGIDFPCPGFRPAQRVEETGRRLANYAETFGVRFKFKAIAQKWETVTIEDLELDYEETLVVNCSYRFRYLLDETVIVDSPRNKVLDLIRKMNPEIYIQGIVNGSYSAPFFLSRFREALFFFSSLFDMLDATVDRGERIERPETYKQWQVRNQRAGFRQVAIDQEIVKKAKDWAISDYHKDFVIDEDGYWVLQGCSICNFIMETGLLTIGDHGFLVGQVIDFARNHDSTRQGG
ncbi:hypothetical protein L1987_62285 [Smallanthus sonchifolius]|uniref:Uncharacterized protein n=1 Tax=Smallanthus sonchifolius TaxID=185202 RepID=A0ACB9C9Y4_9ASTR|nr:hypothetical protein L1987_62285 [Smallanthus sonchifolius]